MEKLPFIQKIDWKLLGEQKQILLHIINWNKLPLLNDHLEGILNTLDAIQDYAVDEMGMSEADVFYTIQDYAVDEMGMSEADVFEVVKAPVQTKEAYICPVCNSDNVQAKCWVGLNNKVLDDYDAKATSHIRVNLTFVEGEHDFCLDCENHTIAQPFPLLITARVIGFQVVGVKGSDKEGEVHPDMASSFCIYNLNQVNEMINYSSDDLWQLLTIWDGDIEEPTMMFSGSPRD